MKASLVIGGSGLVGKALIKRLTAEGIRAFGTYRSREFAGGRPLDVTDKGAVLALLERVQPEAAYLTAAVTHVDGIEASPDEGFRVNVMGTRGVAEACRERGVKLVFFSTDYVFDGKRGPYRESDPPSPVQAYGRQKLEAEAHVLAVRGNLVLRTGGVYGWDPDSKNFVMQVLANLKAGKVMRVPSDQFGNPTAASDLARAAVELVAQDRSGLFHAGGPDWLARHEFGRRAARILGMDARGIQPVDTASLNQPAARPLKGGLVSEKVESLLSEPFGGIEQGLRAFAEEAHSAGAV